MIKAAEKAAKSLKRDFGEVEHLQVSRKGPSDFVSKADIDAQKILREELGRARSTFGFQMEEDDKFPDTSTSAERWIVDPLDGTSNFLHGIGHWAISIGAARGNDIIAGVVYDPIKDETFWAEKGLGAYVNSKRLRVSARGDLSECLIGVGMPFKGVVDKHPGFEAKLNAVMPKVAGIRRMGVASLDLAYVAAGRFDGFWEGRLFPWDVAAGFLLVKEAGGFIAPIVPGDDVIKNGSGSVIASNDAIHNTLVDLLRKA
jgi:myo-inositol-1(or 4)-monophosphatase